MQKEPAFIEKIHDHKNETFFEHARHIEHDLEEKVAKYQKNVIERFPFLFLGLSTFGGVAVFYGFEKIIDRTPYLADNPLGILLAGFVILFLTGALYRKLK
tara:strand:- start:389 stop:691 length:303 start_codon:yes stop_codon:yes gene_type:complete